MNCISIFMLHLKMELILVFITLEILDKFFTILNECYHIAPYTMYQKLSPQLMKLPLNKHISHWLLTQPLLVASIQWYEYKCLFLFLRKYVCFFSTYLFTYYYYWNIILILIPYSYSWNILIPIAHCIAYKTLKHSLKSEDVMSLFFFVSRVL